MGRKSKQFGFSIVPFDTATLVILKQQEIKGSAKSIELISSVVIVFRLKIGNAVGSYPTCIN
jgi:hypothetical protein